MSFDTYDEALTWANREESKIVKKRKALKLVDEQKGSLDGLIGIIPGRVLTAIKEMPFTIDDVMSSAIPCNSSTGVYFLIKGFEVVYVGQSVDIFRRVGRHKDNDIDFDSFTILACGKEDLDRLESLYIDALLPKYNRATPSPWERTRRAAAVQSATT